MYFLFSPLFLLSLSDYGYEHANGITGPCVRDESVTLTNPCASAGVTTYLKSQG